MSNISNPRSERGHKRKAEDQGEDDRTGRKHKQRQREIPFTGTSRPKKHATHRPRNAIRDLERMLAKATDMPATVRAAHERRLEALKHDLVITEAEKEKTRMIERYHMVRFFDRKKAERRLKKTQRSLKECTEPNARPRLEKDAYDAQIDLNYTMYYPLVRNYCSLYPNKKREDGRAHDDDEAIAAEVRGDPEMWKVVERATKEGRLEALKWDLDLDAARQKILAPKDKQKKKKKIEVGKLSEQFAVGTSGKMNVRSRKANVVSSDSDPASDGDTDGGVKLEPQIIDEEDGFFEK
jgi:hypothetical protein